MICRKTQRYSSPTLLALSTISLQKFVTSSKRSVTKRGESRICGRGRRNEIRRSRNTRDRQRKEVKVYSFRIRKKNLVSRRSSELHTSSLMPYRKAWLTRLCENRLDFENAELATREKVALSERGVNLVSLSPIRLSQSSKYTDDYMKIALTASESTANPTRPPDFDCSSTSHTSFFRSYRSYRGYTSCLSLRFSTCLHVNTGRSSRIQCLRSWWISSSSRNSWISS